MTLRSNRHLLKSIFSYTTANLIAQGLVAVYTLLLIWWLNTEVYGNIAAHNAAVLLTSFIITMGLHEWLIRTIPLEKKSKTLTGEILVYKMVVGLIWGAGLMIVLPLIKPEIYIPQLLIIIILDVWFESGFYLLLADLLGHTKVISASWLLIASRVLRLLSLILVILIGSHSALLIVLLRLIATGAIFIIALLISKPVFTQIKNVNIFNILKSSVVFNAAEIQNLIFLQIDLNLLTLVNGDPVLLGDFAVVISVINMIMTLPLGIASMMLPNAIRSYRTAPGQFKKKMIPVLVGFLLFGLVLWASISIFRLEMINRLLRGNYQSVIATLLLISPILLIRTLNQFNRVYLIAVRWEKKQLLPYALAILFKIIAGIFIVRNYELVGLVWLSIISDLLLLVGFSIQTFRHHMQHRAEPTS